MTYSYNYVDLVVLLHQNAQTISTHFRLTTSHSNRRNACALCADALLEFGSFVRGGDWECRAYYVLCILRNTMQIYEL